MSRGFFKLDPAQTVTKPKGCGSCGLYRHCLSPRMPATGEGKKGILVIAEAPGEEEDKRNTQLIGKTGQTLRKALRVCGVDLDRDCRKINAVNCRPPNNRTPTLGEIQCCRRFVRAEIQRSSPKVIIALGASALESLYGARTKQALGITKWRGWTIPDPEHGCWVCPTFHPQYTDYASDNPAVSLLWRQDLSQAVEVRNVPQDISRTLAGDKGRVSCLKSVRAIKRYLLKLACNSLDTFIAFDYETTGLKPHNHGHRIVSCAIAESPSHAVAFQYSEELRDSLAGFLRCASIDKVAGNIKFEETWSRVMLGTGVNNWVWDTVLAAHVLDNRRGITSVKFQAAVRLGVMDYDSHIAPFLKGTDPKNANSLNRIDEVDEEELLVYNGLDALYEYRIALQQMEEMKCGLKSASSWR